MKLILDSMRLLGQGSGRLDICAPHEARIAGFPSIFIFPRGACAPWMRAPMALSQDQILRARQQYVDGMSVRDICREIGTTAGTL
jgi:hypothetical protein